MVYVDCRTPAIADRHCHRASCSHSATCSIDTLVYEPLWCSLKAVNAKKTVNVKLLWLVWWRIVRLHCWTMGMTPIVSSKPHGTTIENKQLQVLTV